MSLVTDVAEQKNTTQPWRKLLLLALLFALVILAVVRIVQSMGRAEKAKPTPVTQIQLKDTELLTVNPSGFAQTLPLSGALTPYAQATVSARASGEVAKVLVREGQTVRKNEVLAILVDTTYRAQYEQAVAAEESAKSALTLAQQDYVNNAALVKDEFISKIALQKLAVSLESARAQLKNAIQAKVIAQRALSEVNIKAPIAGVISARNLREGETAAVGTAMFSIVNTDAFELQAPISAEQIGLIQSGQTVELSSAGVMQPFNGVLERINPAATNGSRSYVAYIRINNPTGALKAGMFAQGQIVVASRDAVISVPATALHTRDEAQYVYVVRDGKLAEQNVTVGARTNDAIDALVEITNGLNTGDVIVRLDLGQLQAGTNVVTLGTNGSVPETKAKKEEARPTTLWGRIKTMFGA